VNEQQGNFVITTSDSDQLYWLDVPDRVLFKLAATVHQCLNGRAPPYLSEHCIPVSSADTRRHLRSSSRHLLAVPRFRLNTYGHRAFSVAGQMAWNSLPDFIRDPTSSIDCFRRLLKTYTCRPTCSRVTSASSALGVLNDYALYKSTHSLTTEAFLYCLMQWRSHTSGVRGVRTPCQENT